MKKQDSKPLREKVDSSIEKHRIKRQEIELRFLGNHRFGLSLFIILLTVCLISAASQFHIVGICFISAFLALIITIFTRTIRAFTIRMERSFKAMRNDGISGAGPRKVLR